MLTRDQILDKLDEHFSGTAILEMLGKDYIVDDDACDWIVEGDLMQALETLADIYYKVQKKS